MKILLCHNFYQQTGGEDVAVLALKELLEQKGNEVIFYSESNREIEEYNAISKDRILSAGRLFRPYVPPHAADC